MGERWEKYTGETSVLRIMNERISYLAYRQMAGKKPSKYRSQKTVVYGILFDSQKEANHYCELKLRKQAREIVDFFRQVPFLLHEGYYKDGKWVKPIYYIADFLVLRWSEDNELIIEVHETKGKWTPMASDKRKMFERRYPQYRLIVI